MMSTIVSAFQASSRMKDAGSWAYARVARFSPGYNIAGFQPGGTAGGTPTARWLSHRNFVSDLANTTLYFFLKINFENGCKAFMNTIAPVTRGEVPDLL